MLFPIVGWIGLLGELFSFATHSLQLSRIRCLACSIANNIFLATASENPGDIFATQTGRFITAVYSMTLVTNLSATSMYFVIRQIFPRTTLNSLYLGLLAYRIWTINRTTTQWRTTDHLSPVLRVVIESGALYSLTIIAAIITFALKSPGVYVILDMVNSFLYVTMLRRQLTRTPYHKDIPDNIHSLQHDHHPDRPHIKPHSRKLERDNG